MRVPQDTPTASGRGVRRQAEVVWPLRRARLARLALRSVALACGAALAVVVLVTVFFVWAFGHALAWSIVGSLFGLLPLLGLALAVTVWLRAAVVAGPRWMGVRILRRWRVVDLDRVQAVRMSDGAFVGFGPLAGRGFSGRRVVFEDDRGGRVDIDLDALGSGVADVVARGLGDDARVDPDAARAIDAAQGQERGLVPEP